eukprot:scaffold297817_cov41-Prasinocladus_malaysianus.AAC.1
MACMLDLPSALLLCCRKYRANEELTCLASITAPVCGSSNPATADVAHAAQDERALHLQLCECIMPGFR